MCRVCYRNRHGIDEVYVPDDVCILEYNIFVRVGKRGVRCGVDREETDIVL